MLHDADILKDCCREVKELNGDAAEIGVYRGESAAIICSYLPSSTVHLFDTFCGIPENTQPVDIHRPGDFHDTSVAIVAERLKAFDNWRVYPGIFPATSIDVLVKLVHVDCDIYQSTWDAIIWSWDHLVGGGIVVSDDYYTGSCPGATLAVDRFLEQHPEAARKRVRYRLVIRKPITEVEQ